MEYSPLFLIIDKLEYEVKEQQKSLTTLFMSKKQKASKDLIKKFFDKSLNLIGLSYSLIGLLNESTDIYTKEHIFLLMSEVFSIFAISLPFLESYIPIFLDDMTLFNKDIASYLDEIVESLESFAVNKKENREFLLTKVEEILRYFSYFDYMAQRIPEDL